MTLQEIVMWYAQFEDSMTPFPISKYCDFIRSTEFIGPLTMEIKGDPYWFGRDNLAKSKDKMPRIIDEDNTLKEEFSVDRTDTEHAPYGAGSVFAGFRYIFPKEYNYYDDDYSSHTGVMEITKADPPNGILYGSSK